MITSLRSGTDRSLASADLSAEKASMMRTMFLCGLIAAGVEDERVIHLVALGDHLAISRGGVAEKETVVKRVVDNLDLGGRHVEQPRQIMLGEVGNREDPSPLPCSTRRVRWKRTLRAKLECELVAIQIVEQVVNGDDIGTAGHAAGARTSAESEPGRTEKLRTARRKSK